MGVGAPTHSLLGLRSDTTLRKVTGDDIRRFRHEHGLSQKDLAARLGLNVMTISRWERGSRTVRQAEVIRRALDVVKRELIEERRRQGPGRPAKRRRLRR
jgi:transcriptional regulator with XRE-family HTH domain